MGFPERETLLENRDGTIVAEGPLVLVCDCQGGLLDALVRLYAPFSLLASILVSMIVMFRAAPPMILFISASWAGAATACHLIARRDNRRHGRFRVDLEKGELLQEGRGFRRSFSLRTMKHVATPVVEGIEATQGEPGLEARWLLFVMANGQELRLGKGTMFSLRPAILFLREAGVPVLGG